MILFSYVLQVQAAVYESCALWSWVWPDGGISKASSSPAAWKFRLRFWPGDHISRLCCRVAFQMRDVWTLIPRVYTEEQSAKHSGLACGATFRNFENDTCSRRWFTLPELGSKKKQIGSCEQVEFEHVQDHREAFEGAFPGSQGDVRNQMSIMSRNTESEESTFPTCPWSQGVMQTKSDGVQITENV